MFRKSAATLFNFSKTVRVTPAVSQTFQRGYILPAEMKFVSSKGYEKIVQSVDGKEANEAHSLSAAIAERSSKIKELASLCEMLDRDNAKDKERLSSVELYTDEKAKAIIERSKQTEDAIICALRGAILDGNDVCEIPYIPGEHLNFLQTVLDEFYIRIAIPKHTEPAGKHRGWCEVYLPTPLTDIGKQHLGDEHPIYKAWLDNFRAKICNVMVEVRRHPSYRS